MTADRTPVLDETEALLKEIEERAELARQEVYAICRGKRWQMTVPVDEERDSDTIICKSLNYDVPKLLSLVRDLQAQIKMLDDEVGILGEAARNEQNFRRALEAELRLSRAVVRDATS